ncbi:hypothetical protein B6N60_03326 [Richelia sinica FACHB-800]|uniref:Uncharacterized protein n=1 Tax=Richelia sinica FACHB-800 TaxID=1357546 RepID=A0A975T9Y3_9NOST|nr:peptidoglycan-binding protein [Richelia sinica]MBD2663439.1 peptidoglycan-binding protein [Richelia sinica FACHB-800]QXE24620.1 hypothetical protein B6N60_03326 [Richelia sinica FACHB-800]
MGSLNQTSRRKILYFLITTIKFIFSKNGIRPARGQSFSIPTGKEPSNLNAANQDQIYQEFLRLAVGGKENKPVLLYQGVKNSPYKDQIKHYPRLLRQRPNGKNLVNGIQTDRNFKSYPILGKIPEIDEQGLSFLHNDIKEACICIGNFWENQFQVKWLGRNALNNVELWSGSKIIPLIYTATLINQKSPFANISEYNLQGLDQDNKAREIPLIELASDLITYEKILTTSNASGGMFKKFASQIEIENWLKNITGNTSLVFRGRYGDKPFMELPNLVERRTGKVIISANTADPSWACNSLSVYDLTRIISTLGWHNYLSQNSRFPFAHKQNLDTIIKILGTDPARLTDLAIKVLGLENSIDSVVIISKLGNGTSIPRERTEAVYVALVQFIDRRPQALGQPAKWITFSLALRGARSLTPRNIDREVVELDARMATEVTEIIQKLILNYS